MHDDMTNLTENDTNAIDDVTEEELGSVHGGMRWEQFRQSKNVEDRRPGRPHNVVPRPRRGPDLSRSSLARDAGINDIGRRRR